MDEFNPSDWRSLGKSHAERYVNDQTGETISKWAYRNHLAEAAGFDSYKQYLDQRQNVPLLQEVGLGKQEYTLADMLETGGFADYAHYEHIYSSMYVQERLELYAERTGINIEDARRPDSEFSIAMMAAFAEKDSGQGTPLGGAMDDWLQMLGYRDGTETYPPGGTPKKKGK